MALKVASESRVQARTRQAPRRSPTWRTRMTSGAARERPSDDPSEPPHERPAGARVPLERGERPRRGKVHAADQAHARPQPGTGEDGDAEREDQPRERPHQTEGAEHPGRAQDTAREHRAPLGVDPGHEGAKVGTESVPALFGAPAPHERACAGEPDDAQRQGDPARKVSLARARPSAGARRRARAPRVHSASAGLPAIRRARTRGKTPWTGYLPDARWRPHRDDTGHAVGTGASPMIGLTRGHPPGVVHRERSEGAPARFQETLRVGQPLERHHAPRSLLLEQPVHVLRRSVRDGPETPGDSPHRVHRLLHPRPPGRGRWGWLQARLPKVRVALPCTLERRPSRPQLERIDRHPATPATASLTRSCYALPPQERDIGFSP